MDHWMNVWGHGTKWPGLRQLKHNLLFFNLFSWDNALNLLHTYKGCLLPSLHTIQLLPVWLDVLVMKEVSWGWFGIVLFLGMLDPTRLDPFACSVDDVSKAWRPVPVGQQIRGGADNEWAMLLPLLHCHSIKFQFKNGRSRWLVVHCSFPLPSFKLGTFSIQLTWVWWIKRGRLNQACNNSMAST